MDQNLVIDHTRRWITSMVIGLNLCPFARRVFEANLIRYVVTEADNETALLDDLSRELQSLASVAPSQVETTLLIHPRVLGDFLDYNDFLDRAERRLTELGLDGVIQIASFHPRYQFADTDAEAVENYTNRSPYPMLHLLREESISQVIGDPDEMIEIPRRNIEMLRAIGIEHINEMLKQIELGPQQSH